MIQVSLFYSTEFVLVERVKIYESNSERGIKDWGREKVII